MDASFRGHLSKAHMAPDKYRRVAAPEANLEQEKGGGAEKRVQEINDAHLLAVESVPGPQVQVRAQGLAEEALAEKDRQGEMGQWQETGHRQPCKPERVWRISSAVCHSFAFCVAEVPESCPKSGPVSVRDPGFPAFSIWWNLPGDASDRVLSDSRFFCSPSRFHRAVDQDE